MLDGLHPLLRAATAAVAVAVLASCGDGEPGPSESRSTTTTITDLRAPDSLAGLTRVDNLRDKKASIVEQPPGVQFIINGYGSADAPALTLEGYYGNPAGIRVISRVLESRFAGTSTGPDRCQHNSARGTTCWQATDTLVLAITAWDERSATDTVAALDEAWRVVTAGQ